MRGSSSRRSRSSRSLLERETTGRTPRKHVHLVSSAESIFDEIASSPPEVQNNQSFTDAPLSARGQVQADNLAQRIAALSPELIVTSPLTRAIQTCLRASVLVPKTTTKFEVTPLCREILLHECDIGSKAAVLTDRYPFLDFSKLSPPNAWWYPSSSHVQTDGLTESYLQNVGQGSDISDDQNRSSSNRVNEFLQWLVFHPETQIVVFSHQRFNLEFENSRIGNSDCTPWGFAEIRTIHI